MSTYASSWAELSSTERRYLIATVIGEARGESEMGIAGVAWVIRNRTFSNQFPDTIQEVVTQHNQFTPWADGPTAQLARAESHRRSDPTNYARIENILERVFNGEIDDPTNGALYFEAIENDSPWMDRRVRDGRLTQNISIITQPNGTTRTFEGTGSFSEAETGHRFYRDNHEPNPAAGKILNSNDVRQLRDLARVIWCGEPPTDNAILINNTTRAYDVQRWLEQVGIATDRGGADGQVDGRIGRRTQDAIKRVEAVLGLHQDGVLDEAVLAALENSRFRSSLRLVLSDADPSTPILSVPERVGFSTRERF